LPGKDLESLGKDLGKTFFIFSVFRT